MTFPTGQLNDPSKIGPGERFGNSQLVLTSTDFQNLLKVGLIAQIKAGVLSDMDGTATPTLAGVVLRNVANATENANEIDNTLYDEAQYIRKGLVAVQVKAGETPAQFGKVYVDNSVAASYGQATATNTDVAVNAEFIEELDTDVWLINLAPAPSL